MIPVGLLLRVIPFVALVLALGGSYWLGDSHATDKAKAAATASALASEHAHRVALAGATKTVTIEVTKYVDRIQTLPGRTTVRDRIISLCDDQGPVDVRPAGASGVDDAGAASDSGDRPVDALAEDLRTAQVNKARQSAMAGALRGIYGANR